MNRTKLTILKIGGSVITDKNEELKARTDAIDRLATEIAKASACNLIIVHGGGSFGHPKAQQYGIKDGLKDGSQKIGFAETHHMMTMLNGLLMDALIWHTIPAISVTTSSVAVTRNGRIESFDHAPIGRLLDMGFLPVMYGDAVLDSKIGFTILSGDQLAASLATHFGAERIIMCTDVDGLYDADPKAENPAKLLEHLTVDELKGLKSRIGGSTAPDVTGGMFGKIAELVPALERNIPVTIVNATKPDVVRRAINGEKVKGTTIGRI